MKRILLIILPLVTLIGFEQLQAQEQLIEEIKLSTWFGNKKVSNAVFTNNQNLDFINYLDYKEEQYLGFTSLIRFKANWEADLKLTLDPFFSPCLFYVKARYFPIKYIGVSAGFFAYYQYIDHFDKYHILRDVDYFTDVYPDHTRRIVNDIGFSAGLTLPVNYKFFHFTLHLNTGLSSYSRFSKTIKQKKIKANQRKTIRYETQPSFNFFIYPEAEVNIDLIRFKKLKLGIQMQMSWYKTNKYINYTRTTSIWTNDSPIIEQIKSPKHALEKFEIDFGVCLTW